MLEPAFLVLRECAELMLIAWTARACLVRARRHDLLPWLRGGTAAGVVLGAALAVALAAFSWSTRTQAVLSVALGLSVLGMASAMLSSRLSIDHHVGRWLQDAIDSPAAPAIVAVFLALAALRETLEIGIFLHAAAAAESLPRLAAGAVLGLAAAALVALAFRSIASRVPLLALFRLSSLLLCLLAIQLALGGLGQLLAALPQGDTPGLPARLAGLLEPGQRAYGYLCALAMVGPVVVAARRWWGESAARAPS
ncbi:FTR1 family protein [Pseudorhodoferax sp.]|uniref:FTR1 family protein n=1 Tax=Pseudorhodoferax sp. TaxID=1993553 RepID=UPI0039E3E4F4